MIVEKPRCDSRPRSLAVTVPNPARSLQSAVQTLHEATLADVGLFGIPHRVLILSLPEGQIDHQVPAVPRSPEAVPRSRRGRNLIG